MGKAEIIETADGIKIHAVNESISLPSVLRLNRIVKFHRREIPLTKSNVMRRDNYTCQYCGTSTARMTLDHIIPRTAGGRDDWENLVCACEDCNSRKGNRTPSEAGIALKRRPKKPHYFSFILQSFGTTPEEWRPYLFMP